MATIIEHIASKRRYVLVGAGFGTWDTSVAGRFLGAGNPQRDSGTQSMLALADGSGVVAWFASDQVRILSVDGKTPEQLLATGTGPYR